MGFIKQIKEVFKMRQAQKELIEEYANKRAPLRTAKDYDEATANLKKSYSNPHQMVGDPNTRAIISSFAGSASYSWDGKELTSYAGSKLLSFDGKYISKMGGSKIYTWENHQLSSFGGQVLYSVSGNSISKFAGPKLYTYDQHGIGIFAGEKIFSVSGNIEVPVAIMILIAEALI